MWTVHGAADSHEALLSAGRPSSLTSAPASAPCWPPSSVLLNHMLLLPSPVHTRVLFPSAAGLITRSYTCHCSNVCWLTALSPVLWSPGLEMQASHDSAFSAPFLALLRPLRVPPPLPAPPRPLHVPPPAPPRPLRVSPLRLYPSPAAPAALLPVVAGRSVNTGKSLEQFSGEKILLRESLGTE